MISSICTFPLRRLLGACGCAALMVATSASSAHGAPSNDAFANRTVLSATVPSGSSGVTSDASAESGEPDHTGAGDGAINSIWFEWTAPPTPAAQVVRFDACQSQSFVLVAAYTGNSVNGLTHVAGADYDCAAQFTVTASTSYKIALDGNGEEGSVQLQVRNPESPYNDAFAAAATLLRAPIHTTDGTTRDSSREPGEPNPHLSAGSVWYSWTPVQSGPTTFSTGCSNPFNIQGDPALAVFTGSTFASLNLVGANDDFCLLGAQVGFYASADTTYRIAVSATFSGAEDRFSLHGRQTVPSAPEIPAQPVKCRKGFKKFKGKCKRKKKKPAKAKKRRPR